MRRLWGLIWAIALLSAPALAQVPCPEGGAAFPPHYPSDRVFRDGLSQTRQVPASPNHVSGLIIPHHLEMPDLIAGGLRRATDQKPNRIILLFPDHFYRATRPFATTRRGFDTVLGPVATDPAAAGVLLAEAEFVEDSCLFGAEHGLRAVLPFLAELFPDVPVLPIAIAISATRQDWDRMADLLEPLLGDDTLLVQATDFSHYLPHHLARQRDQQVLNLLAAGDLDGLAGLVQPDHVDSTGALYLTALLQARRYGAAPVVLESRNLQQKSDALIAETTSYLVAEFTAPAADPGPVGLGEGPVYVLGGDVFLGRSLPRLLSDELVIEAVKDAALGATRGLPLIANLEGVLLPDMPSGLPELLLAMPGDLAIDWARRLNIVGFGLANNHANDIGPSGLAETHRALTSAGIPWFGPGQALHLPGVTIVGLSDLDGAAQQRADRLSDTDLDHLIQSDASVPVVAFVHWGREFLTRPRPREVALADRMRQRGVAAIIGAHPHAASEGLRAISGGDTVILHSLGNFLFDQMPPEASGALAEIRTFRQGTIFLRQLPLPPLYSVAKAAAD